VLVCLFISSWSSKYPCIICIISIPNFSLITYLTVCKMLSIHYSAW
jgi:hypothetical protein